MSKVEKIEKRVAEIPGLALAGNAYHGIGVPDCIRSGMEAANAVASVPVESAAAQFPPRASTADFADARGSAAANGSATGRNRRFPIPIVACESRA